MLLSRASIGVRLVQQRTCTAAPALLVKGFGCRQDILRASNLRCPPAPPCRRSFSASPNPASGAPGTASPGVTAKRVPSDKIYHSPVEALKASGLKDGDTLLVGGFGLCGIPQTMIQTVRDSGIKNLTVVSNNAGTDDYGLGTLLHTKQVKRMVSSYVGENEVFEHQYLSGELEVELTPQGTIAERMRAAGAGIPAFYTRTGYGTLIEKGGAAIKWGPNNTVVIGSKKKETRQFNGHGYVMEEALHGDVAIVKAWRADPYGNLLFRGTAQNFNPEAATAARFTIAQVEEVVPLGSIAPEAVHLPGIHVHAIVCLQDEKRIERLTVRKDEHSGISITSKRRPKQDNHAAATRERIARRAALELKDGMNVNLGIGMPTLASNFLPPGVSIMLQSENGILGMGPYPIAGQEDADLVNAGKETITALPGASTFSAATSFAMIRGGKMDLTIIGAFHISQHGDISSWIIPGVMVKGMGGAMDLVSSGSRVVVIMEHQTKQGKSKVLKECELPITGYRVVDRVITEWAVFDVAKGQGLTLVEIADDITLDKLRQITDAPFKVSKDLKTVNRRHDSTQQQQQQQQHGDKH